MSENMEAMQTEATMPPETTAEDVGTQPPETTAEAPAAAPTEDTTPPESPAADTEAQPPAPWTLPVQYNHEQRELNREEATRYAQMGIRLEALQPTMDQLRLMAAARGQSVPDFVNAWSEAERMAIREDKLRITNGDEVAADTLVQAEMEARRKACADSEQREQAAQEAARQSLQDRMATEFALLQQEFPEIAAFAAVPQEVVDEAVRDNRHLYDAYLRYVRREDKKIQQNTAAQAAAAAASAGSQADQPPVGVNPAIAAAMRAVDDVFG